MERNDQEIMNISEQPKSRWETGKRVVKKVISTVGAGVIGSVLTLALAANTSILKEEPQNQSQAVTTAKAGTDQSYNVEKLSTTTSLADMVEKASKAVVGIVSNKNEQRGFFPNHQSSGTSSGSGVIFRKNDKEAYIVTNNHVIEGANNIEISLENGTKTEAELVGADALTDLAVLKINAKDVEIVMEMGDSDTLRAGDTVVAIGNPLGLEFSRTVTQGIVSAVNRTISVNTSAGNWDLNVIQTDAAINPGNSGGALVNMAGELVGINSLKIAENGVEGLGFAIPANDAKPLIEEMIKNGKVERPYMGIGMVDLEQLSPQYLQELPKNIKGGVIITSVDPESAAAKAGLQIEDILVNINGHDIKNSTELRKMLYTELKVGEKASLQVYRNGKAQTFFIKLTGYPED